jgi:glycosyltransferase involved in cell wall biosynthesis
MHHKPSIAGESGGVKDAVQGGITGILINPENEEQIANAIIQLATKEDTRKTLGENAYQRAKKEFRWEDKIQKIFNAINK